MSTSCVIVLFGYAESYNGNVWLRPFVELMAETVGCNVALNEQFVRLHSCIAACVSARRCKVALMRDLVVQIHCNE